MICLPFLPSPWSFDNSDYIICVLILDICVVNFRHLAFERAGNRAFSYLFFFFLDFLYILFYVWLDQLMSHVMFCCFK